MSNIWKRVYIISLSIKNEIIQNSVYMVRGHNGISDGVCC